MVNRSENGGMSQKEINNERNKGPKYKHNYETRLLVPLYVDVVEQTWSVD